MPDPINGTSIHLVTVESNYKKLSKKENLQCAPIVKPYYAESVDGHTISLNCKTSKGHQNVTLYAKEGGAIEQISEPSDSINLVSCKVETVDHSTIKGLKIVQLDCVAYSHKQYQALARLHKGQSRS